MIAILQGCDSTIGHSNRLARLGTLICNSTVVDCVTESIAESTDWGTKLWAWGTPPGGTLNYYSWSRLRGEFIATILIGMPSCRDAIHRGWPGGGMVGRLIGKMLVGTRGTFAGDSRDGVAKGYDDRDRVLRVERRDGERKKKLLNQVPRGFQLICLFVGEAG